MGRQDLIKKLKAAINPAADNPLKDLILSLEKSAVIPIISNSVIYNRIFDIDNDGNIGVNKSGTLASSEDNLAIDEELAGLWAASMEYPLAETPLQLSRVAQYNQVKHRGLAKPNYLRFLKLVLLTLAEQDEDVNVVQALETLRENEDIEAITFSQLASELGYPKFGDKHENPLRLLAELPIPIYVTTSHHDFIQRALVNAGKTPHTYICPWHLKNHEHPQEPPEPTIQAPVVYHLYGAETTPDSMVISEDDYLDFLVRVTDNRAIIPVGLRGALAESSLLLLGYRLRGWDLRVLFRSVLRSGEPHFGPDLGLNLAIQLNPKIQQRGQTEQQRQQRMQEALRYLETYFEVTSRFTVRWEDTLSFVKNLTATYEGKEAQNGRGA